MSGLRAVRLPQAELVSEEPAGWDMRILFPTGVLVVIGLAMVYSAAIPVTTLKGKDILTYLVKEGLILAPMIRTKPMARNMNK